MAMNVLGLPFNKIMMIKDSAMPDRILMLEDRLEYQNHLGTVHASAQYALAEATSGEVLERNFGDWKGSYFPVLRRVDVKYKSPAVGRLFSTGFIKDGNDIKAKNDLSVKGRALFDILVKVMDERDEVTFEGIFTWFIARDKGK